MMIQFQCMKPFDESPAFTIRYSIGSSDLEQALRFPIICSKFMVPTDMPSQTFEMRWNSLDDSLLKEDTFEAKHGINPAYVKQMLVEKFNLATIQTLDPTNFFGAGLLLTGSLSKSQQKISVGGLIRVEMSPGTNMCKVSVKTVHANLTHGMFQAIKSFI